MADDLTSDDRSTIVNQENESIDDQMATIVTTTDERVAFSNNQTLDDFVAEHCEKIGIGGQSAGPSNVAPYGIQHQQHLNESAEVQVPSPSDKFQNLCLYSPPPDEEVYHQTTLETIDEAAFKQFLYGTGM